jgi:hypothetical protein
MNKEFLGLAQAAFASSALLIPACSAEPSAPGIPTNTSATDGIPPSIVSATAGEGVLTLRFSKPLAPVAKVDPSKFRLTFGYKSGRTDSYQDYYYASSRVERTWYTDLGRFSAETSKLRQLAPDVVQIPLPADWNATWVCDDITRMQRRGNAAAGLFLHYAESGGPAVTDTNGNRLRSVAPYWMTHEAPAVPGNFTDKPIAVALRCR